MSGATHRLLVRCPDRPGIVAAVSQLLFETGANIIQSDQYSSDPSGGTFFLRMEFTAADAAHAEIARRLEQLAPSLEITWRLSAAAQRKRVAILVSKEDHCLQDLLYRWRRGELGAEVAMVISNHTDHRETVEAHALPFHHVPVKTPADMVAAEGAMLGLLDGACDLVVLARYMRILSGDFLSRVAVPVINIHHSFLPAFAGAEPYARARERGVKLIGATAHYVTEELDAGPIIEQDVNRVPHHDDVAALTRIGSDIERTVLARAVLWHCEDRVLRHGETTVVF